MKNRLFFISISTRHLALIILVLVFYSCHRNSFFEDDDRFLTILKTGRSSFTKSEFEDACNKIENSGVSKDSAIKRTLKACIFNSILLNYLDSIHFELSNEDLNELAFLNRNTLISLAKDSLLEQIKANSMDVKAEIKMFLDKQIVVDYIWLPHKDQKIIDECFSFLSSGGNVVDMLFSDKRYFERITTLKGQIRRINAEPGQFHHKVSKFIALGKKDDTKIFRVWDSYFIIKILYTKKDNFQYWSYNEVKRNLQVSTFLNYAPMYSNINISDINLEVLNNADFNIRAITENSKYAANFCGRELTLDEIKNQINALPFNQKVIFNNPSCKLSAIATLVLLNANKKPFNTRDLVAKLSKEKVQAFLKVNNNSNIDFDKTFDYQWLQLIEKSTFYPWLYPFLFQNFDSVYINYDLLYNNQLVDFKDFKLNDTIAMSKNINYLIVSDFIKELDATNMVTIVKLMNINNAKKFIYYYFESSGNFKPQDIRIDTVLLENVLLGYIRNIEFENFTYGIIGVTDRNPRKYYSGNTQIYNSPELTLNINELRGLINEYPNIIRSKIKTDQTNFNRFWRLDALIDIIDHEIWIKRANELNLKNSITYKLQEEKNLNKILIRSFLNLNIKDTSNCRFFSKTKYNKPLEIWIDTLYFGSYTKYIDSLNISESEILYKYN